MISVNTSLNLLSNTYFVIISSPQISITMDQIPNWVVTQRIKAQGCTTYDLTLLKYHFDLVKQYAHDYVVQYPKEDITPILQGLDGLQGITYELIKSHLPGGKRNNQLVEDYLNKRPELEYLRRPTSYQYEPPAIQPAKPKSSKSKWNRAHEPIIVHKSPLRRDSFHIERPKSAPQMNRSLPADKNEQIVKQLEIDFLEGHKKYLQTMHENLITTLKQQKFQ